MLAPLQVVAASPRKQLKIVVHSYRRRVLSRPRGGQLFMHETNSNIVWIEDGHVATSQQHGTAPLGEDVKYIGGGHVDVLVVGRIFKDKCGQEQ